MNDIERFLDSQNRHDKYLDALNEVKSGKKKTHWMWYVFPQVVGLGLSPDSYKYAIKSKEEAIEYLYHPILGPRLIEISIALLELDNVDIVDVLGQVDALKLNSSMTLFHIISQENPNNYFLQVISKYFNNKLDNKTIEILDRFYF